MQRPILSAGAIYILLGVLLAGCGRGNSNAPSDAVDTMNQINAVLASVKTEEDAQAKAPELKALNDKYRSLCDQMKAGDANADPVKLMMTARGSEAQKAIATFSANMLRVMMNESTRKHLAPVFGKQSGTPS
jgi:hypothetical protein